MYVYMFASLLKDGICLRFKDNLLVKKLCCLLGLKDNPKQ